MGDGERGDGIKTQVTTAGLSSVSQSNTAPLYESLREARKTRALAQLNQAVWEASQWLTLDELEAFVQCVLRHRKRCTVTDRALDTGEPQGSSPTSSVPAVSPPNLDRLAGEIRDALDYGGDYMPTQNCRDSAIVALADLLARVRALEAVTQAAREWAQADRSEEVFAALRALRSALAVVDGGGTESE